MRKLLSGSLVALLVAIAACQTKANPSPTLTSLVVNGTAALTHKNQTTQLTATANLSNSTTQDVSAQSNWSSSNSNILTVTSTGLVTAVGNGTATVTAAYQGSTGTLSMTVTLQANPTVAVVWRRLCGPFRFQLNVTLSETSSDAGMNVTSLTETMRLFGVVKHTRTFSTSELNSFLTGGNHINAGQAKLFVFESNYPGNEDTEDSIATIDASFTDDFGHVKNVTAVSVGRIDC